MNEKHAHDKNGVEPREGDLVSLFGLTILEVVDVRGEYVWLGGAWRTPGEFEKYEIVAREN